MLEIILLQIIPEVIGFIILVWLFTRVYKTMKPIYRVGFVIVILFLFVVRTVNIASTIAIKKIENFKRVQPFIDYPHIEKNKNIKDQGVLKKDISAGELRQASLLNNNINLFIKEFNKKYKTDYVYKIKLPKETEGKKEKYIEAIEMIYEMENAISQITYAIKEGKKGNDPNKVILNMRRYQEIPEEIRMLDNKLGSLIEEMNKKYKTKFMYKVKGLDSETNKKIRVSDINYISAMSSGIEDMYNFIRR